MGLPVNKKRWLIFTWRRTLGTVGVCVCARVCVCVCVCVYGGVGGGWVDCKAWQSLAWRRQRHFPSLTGCRRLTENGYVSSSLPPSSSSSLVRHRTVRQLYSSTSLLFLFFSLCSALVRVWWLLHSAVNLFIPSSPFPLRHTKGVCWLLQEQRSLLEHHWGGTTSSAGSHFQANTPAASLRSLVESAPLAHAEPLTDWNWHRLLRMRECLSVSVT